MQGETTVGPGRQPAEGHTMAVEQLQALEAERASVNDVLNALEELFGKEPEKGFRWFHLCKKNTTQPCCLESGISLL